MLDPEKIISTAALTADDVPSAQEPLMVRGTVGTLPEIWKFAVTYAPPRTLRFELLGFIATAIREHWQKTSELPNVGLDAWRMALLWMFHHWRHTHGDADSPWASDDSEEVKFTRYVVSEIYREIEDALNVTVRKE